MKMSGNESLQWGGEVLAADAVGITLRRGWNWLGYVPIVELSPDVAFMDAQPMRGDEIKSQVGFASYDGFPLVGTLQMLQPGEGI